MIEIWKDIPDYEGLYQVSNLGRIKSLKYWSNVHKKYFPREHIMTNKNAKFGYQKISLSKNHYTKNFLIHVLVAKVFVPNPENKPEINHIDGNKTNNNANNLEYVTRSENMLHAYKTGLKRANQPAKPVIQRNLEGKKIKEWDNIAQIKRELGFDYSSICQCCNNKRNKAYNFIWQYKEVF